MLQEDVHKYLKTFFDENDSPVLEESPGHLHIQLSVDMDKALMNRPFYWQYLEKIGGVPNPWKMTVVTDENAAPEDINKRYERKAEAIHFGSPRLHQVFNLTKELGSHVRMYEKVARNNLSVQSLPLQPWLNMNMKISYEAEKKRDRLFSVGLCLTNGEMIEGFYNHLKFYPLEPEIPDYCFTVSPLIRPVSGVERIREQTERLIRQENHTWAEEAFAKMREDIELLRGFYSDSEELPDSYHSEKEAIERQYSPVVTISVINGGLFYLHQHPLNVKRFRQHW
ncbi:YqhG family protein [Alteribacter natronophilus]|uniref:YqhG family protein n=1 Tax=Alteribacter natronophilus TaxID=2583810 RepID=UPI00110D5F47|nr:YqhG family protein [Alteribacter natronophilus]TMW73774.1 hypothetical protein FGB90_05670 [Alteribacter natronophilus]